MDMENLHHRSVHLAGSSDIESESSESEDEEDMHSGPQVDYSDEEEKNLVDPGPFRYHKKICAAALPCFLIVLGFVGEIMLTIMTVGTVLLILLDRLGEKRRSVIIYTLFFIPCHILVFVSVLPLVWLSLWNIFLIGAVNFYVILIGGWIILLFPGFRMEEPQLAQVIEQLLFGALPGICTVLITWTFTTFTHLSVAPLVAMVIAFVLLQVFLTPAVSSFRLKATADEDMNVLQQPIVVAIMLLFCLLPSLLHVVLCVMATSTDPLFSQRSLLQLCFTLALSLFLATLLSVRQIFEYTGFSYTIVTRGRWICGMLATLLCYPMMQQYRLSSHFLPWLPVAIVTFAVLGLLLGTRKYWIASVILIVGLASLLGFWMLVFPWHLSFYLLGSIEINMFYLLLCAHFTVCLACLYVPSYGNKELFSFLVSLHSLLLTVCETALHGQMLYNLTLCVVTTVLATYMLQRLHHADRLWLWSVLFSSSVHITKGLSCLLTELVLKHPPGLLNYAALFLLIFSLLQSFVYEPREAVPLKEAARNLVFLLVSLAINTFPVLHLLCYNLWQDTPSCTDLIGMWFLVGGVLVLLFAQVHSEVVSEIRLSGLLMLVVGGVVLMLEPDCQLSLSAIFQWSEIASLLLLLAVLMVKVGASLQFVVAMATLTAICPSIRAVFILYGDSASLLHYPLYMTSCGSVLTLLLLYTRVEDVSQSAEKTITVSSIMAAVSMGLVLVLDLVLLDKVTVATFPVLKSLMCVSVCLSVLMKMLAVKMMPDYIPVVTHPRDEKVKPILPLMGNIVTVAAFFFLCLQGPTEGFLHDMWCCASSLILFCLQRDFHVLKTLRDHNQQTPTILSSIIFLVLASIYRSILWNGAATDIFWGISEILVLLPSLPVFVVLWGILWKNEIISEHLVVFTMPLNGFLYLLGTTYTMWAIATCGFLAGIWMMVFRLPMVPYGNQFQTS